MNDYSFGITLKAIRRRQGLSQGELARKMGLSQTAISHWEHGRFWPSVPSLFSLAKALRVPVGDLFEWEPDPDDDFPSAEEIERRGQRIRERLTAS